MSSKSKQYDLAAILEKWDRKSTSSLDLAAAIIQAAQPEPPVVNPTPWYIDITPMNYGPCKGTQKVYIKDANNKWVATASDLNSAQKIVETINKAEDPNWVWPGYKK